MALVIIIPTVILVFLYAVTHSDEIWEAYEDHQDRKTKIKELELKARIKEAENGIKCKPKTDKSKTSDRDLKHLNDYVIQITPGQYTCVCEFCGDTIAVRTNDYCPTLLDSMRQMHGWHARKGQYPICKTCWPEYLKKIEKSKQDKINIAIGGSGNQQTAESCQSTDNESNREF